MTWYRALTVENCPRQVAILAALACAGGRLRQAELRRRSGLGWGNLSIHLDPLEARGLVERITIHQRHIELRLTDAGVATLRRLVHGSVRTCANGHPWTPETTYPAPDGTTQCIPCRRAASRRYHTRQREVVA